MPSFVRPNNQISKSQTYTLLHIIPDIRPKSLYIHIDPLKFPTLPISAPLAVPTHLCFQWISLWHIQMNDREKIKSKKIITFLICFCVVGHAKHGRTRTTSKAEMTIFNNDHYLTVRPWATHKIIKFKFFNIKLTFLFFLTLEYPQMSDPQKSYPQRSRPQESHPQRSRPQRSRPQRSRPQKSVLKCLVLKNHILKCRATSQN